MKILLSLGKFNVVLSRSFSCFLALRTWRQCFLLLSLIIALLFFMPWHAWMSLWTSLSTPSSWKMPHTFSSSTSSLTDVGIPINSRHSRLEYWALSQHCRSVWTNCSASVGLTFLTIATSAYATSTSFLNNYSTL